MRTIFDDILTLTAETLTLSKLNRINKDNVEKPANIKIGIVVDPCYLDPNMLIGKFREYNGIDVWKIVLRWDQIEPTRGSFSVATMNKVKQILDAAQQNEVKVQLSLNQVYWPSWTGCTSNKCGGKYPRFTDARVNGYLKDVWVYIVNEVKNYSSLDSYLIVNEDGALQEGINIDVYIVANNYIVSSIRQIDPNHKIVTRALCSGASNYSLLRYKIAHDGLQDIDNGYTSYAVGSQSWNHNESPTSFTSMIMTSVSLREINPLGGKPTEVGEIGYYKGTIDTWGDEERLKGFKRCLSIAYENGCNEFYIWSCGDGKPGGFSNPSIYFPKLKQFRDQLRPRDLTRFNVRVLLDNTSWLSPFYPQQNRPSTKESEQPYYYLMMRLDEGGYSWFYTHSVTAQYLPNIYDKTIKTSEIVGKTIEAQESLINNRLQGIIPKGNFYSWSSGDVTIR